jgi:carboxyl-terminal processing protease
VLTVIPASDASGTVTKTVELVRDEVKLEDQAASGAVRTVTNTVAGAARKLGVVRLPGFYGSMDARSPDEPGYRSAVHDVVKILGDLQQQSIQGLLLDLRGNGGGSLVEAIDMTGLFIRQGPTVQVKERFTLRALDDEDPRLFYAGPMVVLVNRLSASASEILAGALQDYGRAVIVGDSKTHGKGTVQSVLDLGRDKNLGAIKVTTASYIRISGASTQQQGVQPDIIVPSPWDFIDTGEEFLPNSIPWSMEQPTTYHRVADLTDIVPQLRERSEQRRRQNAQFQAYARFLERIAQMNTSHELSLNLDERRHLAQTEKELSELQEKLTTEAEEDAATTNAADAADLVLTEGLNILSDLVDLEKSGTNDEDAPPVDTVPRRSVADWLRTLP